MIGPHVMYEENGETVTADRYLKIILLKPLFQRFKEEESVTIHG